ncbi:MAG: DUF1905 domain-containing protein [Acidobacteriota bacterium]|nr:DUF1905 domain-containing protein [Acidobacteriota bacterium]
MELSFDGEIWYWRGPSPFHFVTVPAEQSDQIHAVSNLVSYGWGVVPVAARIGDTRWTTSLFPKDGGYLVPIKSSVRQSESLELGDRIRLHLTLDVAL